MISSSMCPKSHCFGDLVGGELSILDVGVGIPGKSRFSAHLVQNPRVDVFTCDPRTFTSLIGYLRTQENLKICKGLAFWSNSWCKLSKYGAGILIVLKKCGKCTREKILYMAPDDF